MHRHYSEERALANKPTTTYDTYARIFNTEFNIGFFAPKKDQCDLCESYKNNPNNTEVQKAYEEHQEEKKLSRNEKDQDKSKAKNQDIVLAVYDLQAVLPVPMAQTSIFFYKSRLNCFNFTVTEIGNDKTFCFFWHEGLGHRGAAEIGTCVLLYLEELSKTKPGADVVFYSDNCGGQQKNKYVPTQQLLKYSIGLETTNTHRMGIPDISRASHPGTKHLTSFSFNYTYVCIGQCDIDIVTAPELVLPSLPAVLEIAPMHRPHPLQDDKDVKDAKL
ncbi:uncharacterized protein LOC116162721 [Photinus pyralis]|uniref:uncharacterized protein LOC116162721 n=1 Tax=Photinus pyralis TaxID=7054 RepID=UPI001266EF73|nr:uncharacterized protein LOC116162721 [Photinus pyralis]